MTKLPEDQYKELIAAINGERYNRLVVDKAIQNIRYGLRKLPSGGAGFKFPSGLIDWQANPAFAIQLIDSHQRACDLAWSAYWTELSSGTKPVPQTDAKIAM